MPRWEMALLPWDLLCSPGKITWEEDLVKRTYIAKKKRHTFCITYRIEPITGKSYVTFNFLNMMTFVNAQALQCLNPLAD